MKLLQYTRYMNVSHSDRLETLFQTITDVSDYIPMPSISNHLENGFENHPLPTVFARYDLPSNFMINQGDALLAALVIMGLLVLFLIMQRGIFYVRNVPILRSLIIKTRFFFQNYLISMFYEMLSDIAFAAVLEMKTLSINDPYSELSFAVCMTCLIFGVVLYSLNIWIVYAYQKKRESHSEEESRKEALEKFSEKYKGIEILFNDFKDQSFIHQGVLIFFVGRNIAFCLVIALFPDLPLFQAMLLLTFDLCLVAYYLLKRSIKSRMDFVEQLSYEIILLIANVCFFIQALADAVKGGSSQGLTNTIGEIIIVLNTICKFLPFVFLGTKLSLALWGYYLLFKLAWKSGTPKKNKKVSPDPSRHSSDASPSSDSSNSPQKFSDTSATRFLGLDGSTETTGNLDQTVIVSQAAMTQMDLLRSRGAQKRSVVPFDSTAAKRRLLGLRPFGDDPLHVNRVHETVPAIPFRQQIAEERRVIKVKKRIRQSEL